MYRVHMNMDLVIALICLKKPGAPAYDFQLRVPMLED